MSSHGIAAARSAGWLLVLLMCGCPAGPSEVELTVDLGPEQVDVQATLRDVQVWTEDPVEALRAFQQVHAPEAPFAAQLLGQLPWMPRLQRWEWRVRGQALDLVLAGAMPRSQFDTCVALSEQQRADASEHPAPCTGFPLWRSGDEYRSILEPRDQEYGEPDWTALGPTRWPLRERRLQTRFRLKELTSMRGSALPSFQLHSDDPEAVSSYVALIERYGTAFRAGDTPACKAIRLEAMRILPPRIFTMFEERVLRERLWLIDAVGTAHMLPPVNSLPTPQEYALDPPKYASLLLPLQAPPELMLLKLVRLHDQAVAHFGLDWTSGRKKFSLQVDETKLEGLCGELARKAPAYRRLCQHLVGTRQPSP